MSNDTYSAMPNQDPGLSNAMIDLRSDTVTQPGAGMREAMANAAVGDDVYGEDPTVLALEQQLADLTGKQAGLFVSSGTLSNLIAMLAQCQRGEEYLAGINYHTISSEAGGAAALGGIVPCVLDVDEQNSISIASLESAIKPDDPHYPVTKLLCLENTVAGKVQPLQHIQALSEIAHQHGLNIHLDGARIMHAAIASELPIASLLTSVDTVSVCLSKGLGAPVGSVLLGSQDFIQKALRLRKMLGGATRQAGVLAACGLYALEHNINRLAEDHDNAQYLAEGLADIKQLDVQWETNMVFIKPPEKHIAPLVKFLAQRKILVGAQHPSMRLVTHLDVNKQDIALVIKSIVEYFSDK